MSRVSTVLHSLQRIYSPLLLVPLLILSMTSCDGLGGKQEDAQISKEMPCLGDPYYYPQLARQRVSGIDGAKFGKFRTAQDGSKRMHKGIDLEMPDGTSLHAMCDGYIYQVGEMNGYGKCIIYLGRMNGEAVMIMYAHLDRSTVSVGSLVSAGEVIAYSGRTGNLEEAVEQKYTRPHMHLEIRMLEAGEPFTACEPVNPEDYMSTELDYSGNPVFDRPCHHK